MTSKSLSGHAMPLKASSCNCRETVTYARGRCKVELAGQSSQAEAAVRRKRGQREHSRWNDFQNGPNWEREVRW